jgi:hypothetical protein
MAEMMAFWLVIHSELMWGWRTGKPTVLTRAKRLELMMAAMREKRSEAMLGSLMAMLMVLEKVQYLGES